ncbi:steroid 21-hydroxylase, partial [Rhea pennata]|uniref:steroid 21-hydroxylase n=1 Tax=Rhea pennata TaxID=8795 RepID=UPI002E26ECD9
PALPLLGTAAHLLHPAAPRHLGALARRYGPALRLRLGGTEWTLHPHTRTCTPKPDTVPLRVPPPPDVLVLSSVETIREAFTRRWGACAGRPPSYLAGLVSRGGQDLALGDISPGWRRQRRATRDALARAQGHLDAILSQQAEALCQDLRRYRGAPADVAEDFAFRTCSTICSLVFGSLMPPEAEVRDFTRCIMGLLELWGRASVRVLDLLPPLRALPNPALRELLRLVERRDAFVQTQLQRHEAAGCPAGGVLGELWPDPGVRGGPLGPGRLHMALVDLFIGGTETTAAALGWAVAFLLHRPEVAAGARAEAAGGSRRLLAAIVGESLRLRPPAPLALPHRACTPTSIAGIPVPRDSLLIPNLFAAHHDPDKWHRPEDFLPERFLAAAPGRALVPFGCGARACLGEGLARAELLVFLGHILRHFRLEPPAPGVLPSLEVTAGTVLRCRPFRVRLIALEP